MAGSNRFTAEYTMGMGSHPNRNQLSQECLGLAYLTQEPCFPLAGLYNDS
jgi:hypothetical protein